MKVYNIKTGGIRHTGKEEPDFKIVHKVLKNMYDYIFWNTGQVRQLEARKSIDIISKLIR